MIRLSLPPFDPTRPLEVRASCSIQGWAGLADFVPFHMRVHPDNFVGDQLLPFEKITIGSNPSSVRVPFAANLSLNSPEIYGLTGAENWFDLVGVLQQWIFVHDLVVYYTPRDQQDIGRAAGFFS